MTFDGIARRYNPDEWKRLVFGERKESAEESAVRLAAEAFWRSEAARLERAAQGGRG